VGSEMCIRDRCHGQAADGSDGRAPQSECSSHFPIAGREKNQAGQRQTDGGAARQQLWNRGPGPAAGLGVNGDRDLRRVVIDGGRRIESRDVAQEEHRPFHNPLLRKRQLRIQRSTANPHQRPARGDASVALAQHLDEVPEKVGDWNADRQRDVESPPGADDCDATRQVDVVYLYVLGMMPS